MEVTSRHHLRSDAISRIRDRVEGLFGVELAGETFEAVTYDALDWEIIMVDGSPLVVQFDPEPVLTVRGANALQPSRRVVVVDAGAVQFVSDGADIMRPGIVEADEEIAAGDPVVIVEETHGKTLAIGRSRVDGPELRGDQGKVIDTLHHVGDDIYQVTD